MKFRCTSMMDRKSGKCMFASATPPPLGYPSIQRLRNHWCTYLTEFPCIMCVPQFTHNHTFTCTGNTGGGKKFCNIHGSSWAVRCHFGFSIQCIRFSNFRPRQNGIVNLSMFGFRLIPVRRDWCNAWLSMSSTEAAQICSVIFGLHTAQVFHQLFYRFAYIVLFVILVLSRQVQRIQSCVCVFDMTTNLIEMEFFPFADATLHIRYYN